MGLTKLWGKDSNESHGFAFSHIKTIYYNWTQKKLLSTKLDEMDSATDAKSDISHTSTSTEYGGGNSSQYGHVKLSDNYSSSSGSASESVAASSKAVVDAYSALNNNKISASSPTIINPTLRFSLGGEESKVEFRRAGSTNNGLSIVFTNSNGSNTFHNLIDENGDWQIPPISHESTEWTYGVGTSANYGHCRIIDNLTSSANKSGYALSAYQGYVIDNKIGTKQIVSLSLLSCSQSTYVSDGGTWDNVKGTFSSVSGATSYSFIPLACNYGFVTSVSISGTTVTCKALNASGASHTCGITGLLIAYKGESITYSTVRITSSQTWTVPTGVTKIDVLCVGGGGGGAGSWVWRVTDQGSPYADCESGGGGAGGQVVLKTNISVTPGTKYTATVGAGGAGGKYVYTTSSSAPEHDEAGSKGGTTSLGNLCSAEGGPGATGRGGASGTNHASGGTGSKTSSSAATSGAGGTVVWGATYGGGGGGGNYRFNDEGTNRYSANGAGGAGGGGAGGYNIGTSNTNPVAGTANTGGGGGGGWTSESGSNGSGSAGAAGGSGIIVIRWQN